MRSPSLILTAFLLALPTALIGCETAPPVVAPQLTVTAPTFSGVVQKITEPVVLRLHPVGEHQVSVSIHMITEDKLNPSVPKKTDESFEATQSIATTPRGLLWRLDVKTKPPFGVTAMLSPLGEVSDLSLDLSDVPLNSDLKARLKSRFEDFLPCWAGCIRPVA